MSFWQYCEYVAQITGDDIVMSNINTVRRYWETDSPVGECANDISKDDPANPVTISDY